MRLLTLAAAGLLTSAPAGSQTISRTSAPTLGKTLTIEYSSSPGVAYVMLVAAPPPVSLTIPGIAGTLFLDPATFFDLYVGVVPNTGKDIFNLPLPADPTLVDACIDMQAIEYVPALLFSENFVELCVDTGIGTITLASGLNASTLLGDLEVETVTSTSAGAPATQGLGMGAIQPIQEFGHGGFKPLVSPTSTLESADMAVDLGTVVARDHRDPAKPHVKLPNGFDFFVLRDHANRKLFYLLSLDRSTGVATELTDSRVTDLHPNDPTPTCDYRPQFAFTADGEVAVALVHDSTNSAKPNVGPPDRVFLIHTDPAKTWGNAKNVIDVSPAAGPERLHTSFNGTLRICNGIGLVEGEHPDGVSGGAALWGGPIDGSAPWARIAVPRTGTNLRFFASFPYWRTSDDGTTNVFLSSGNTTAPFDGNMDVMALTGIGSGPVTVVNITAFPASVQVQTFGHAGTGIDSLRGALSPDGANVAVVIGGNTAASPGSITIVPTDGSKAGAVQPFTAGRFDPKVVIFQELHWVGPTALLFTAGSGPTAVDYYLHETSTVQTWNLTGTTDGSTTAPFCAGGTHTGNIHVRGSFLSENHSYYYFVRGYTLVSQGVTSDWKGIDLTTFAIFDVTGSEFSSGTAPSLRPLTTNVASWMVRRSILDEVFFAAAPTPAGPGSTDEEIFKFTPELGGQAVQLTSNNGSGNAGTTQQVADLKVDPSGAMIAWSQGVGTSSLNPEELFVLPASGGTPTRISRKPASGGLGIARGSVHFVGSPVDAICWVQGTNSRTAPTLQVVALWARFHGMGAPLRLSEAPVASPRYLTILGASILNP